MKYGIIPTNILERVALWTGNVPVPMVDALFGPLKARAIMAGVTLGVFDAMREGEHASADLAARLSLDPGALDLLLRGLVVSDYLVQRGDRFALSPLARRTMVAGAPMELTGLLRFNYAQWEFIAHLEQLVRSGRGLDFHQTMTSSEHWRDYQRGMLEGARIDAPIVAARVPVPKGATSLLDIAGSHGLFGALICRRLPAMRSTVIDLPQAIVHARALAKAEGIAHLVTHREGDVMRANLGHDHDVVLLANILHHLTRERIVIVLERARTAMRRGGTVAIWEIEAPKKGSKVTNGDGAALYFRLTSTAGAFHGDEYASWLQQAGFSAVKITRPTPSPGKVLLTARA